jgi:transposase
MNDDRREESPPPSARDSSTRCPYCRRPLRWSPGAVVARGVFECDRCGPFTDFCGPVPVRRTF